MLYILHQGNHPELNYKEGQGPIVHLQADFHTTIQWAVKKKVRWAFTDRNAGTYLVKFFNDPNDLEKLNWKAIDATDFRDMVIKEGKQAEFLVFDAFPWSLVEEVGVRDASVKTKVSKILKAITPPVRVKPEWYY